jgi:hypothetical protein
MKINIIRNERERINQRCSSSDLAHLHNEKFDQILAANGYPREFINKSRVRQNHLARRTSSKYFYVKLPFVSDELNWKIRSIFRSENIPIRFYHPNKSFRNLLAKRQGQSTCTTQDCHFRSICQWSNIVYQIQCMTCLKTYIGSTIRRLHYRLVEHMRTQITSSVFQHLRNCIDLPALPLNEKLNVKVLARENDPINLRIKEGLFIKERRPQLNSREEIRELQMLV